MHVGFSKNPSRDPLNPRWRRSAILDLDDKKTKENKKIIIITRSALGRAHLPQTTVF